MDKAAFGNQSGCYRNSKESFCLDHESCFHDICLLFPKFYDDIWIFGGPCKMILEIPQNICYFIKCVWELQAKSFVSDLGQSVAFQMLTEKFLKEKWESGRRP